MRRLGLPITLAVAAIALLPAAASARGPLNYVVHLGKGAGGVGLLDSRSTVVGKLGRPFYENANGYMQYQPDPASRLFDIYRTSGARTSHVRLVSVADDRFRLDDGLRIFAAGGLMRLKARVGSKLKIVKQEDGEQTYVLAGSYRGHKTFTDFGTPLATSRSRVLQIFIGLD